MKKLILFHICLLGFLLLGFQVRAQQLNGAYTINPSQATSTTNFQTLTSAVNALAFNGVSGPITFSVASGTYTGQIIIPLIPGVSAANTITFQSAANNADSVVLSYAASANTPVVKLDGANYINFKYIKVVSTTTDGRAFELSTTASYDSIINCKTTTGNAGIYANPLSGSNNVFSFNTISGSTYGIYLMGPSTTSFTNNNVITGNTIQAGNSGLYLYSTQNLMVSGNKINSGNFGVYIYYSSNAFVVNNSIIAGSGIGIQNYYGSGQRFYHNSVKGANQGVLVNYTSTDNNNGWRNNILTNSATSYAARLVNAGTGNSWDYNLYFTTGASVLYNSAAAFSAWQTNGQDVHSVVGNPKFISTTDLHLAVGCGNIYGTSLPVTTDLDGNGRSSSAPTFGAYEYSGVYNIAIDSLLKPKLPISAGVQDMVVRVKNTGTNPITFFTVTYELNGGGPVSQVWSGSMLGSCDTVSVIFSGINMLARNILTVYTSLPDDSNDTYKQNDTLRAALNTPLNGVYTIGNSGADFTSFSQAVNELVLGGITGPVVFNVKSGVYTEQVIIPAINGVSLTNTITFQSAANNADSVTLSYTSGGSANPVVRLVDASYINFKYITVSTTTGRAFELTANASYDSIVRCRINANYIGISANPLAGRKNVIAHNTIVTGAEGISLRGSGTTINTDSNVIMGNTIKGSAGLSLYYGSNTFVTNNSIIGSEYGIYNYYGTGQHFYHNSVATVPGNSYSYGVYVVYNNILFANNEWKNNIITNLASLGNAAYTSNTGLNNTWDYNLYYNVGPNLFNDDVAGYTMWRSTGQDSHSVAVNPNFVSVTDLHLLSGCKQGTALPFITEDIDGITRSVIAPTMGAYEYSGNNDIALDGLVRPVFPVSAGLQNIAVRIKNIGLNPVTSFTINYVLNGGSPVSQIWSTGTIGSCDTVSVIIPGVNLLNKNTLTFYTTLPNGVSDTYKNNDTLRVVLNTPLNGSYTIGNSGADFTSFNQAVGELMLGGVSGPVVFNVKSGTYIEQVVIPEIQGVSAVNTITFKSAVNNADSVVINYAVGNNLPIINLKGASYINFKYITVSAIPSTPGGFVFGRAFQLTTTASYDSILYCKVGAGNAGIYASPITGKKNVFSYNNIFRGDNYGIFIGGNYGFTALTDSNIITCNTIRGTGSQSTALRIEYGSNTIVVNNDIKGSFNGVNSFLCSGSRFYHNTINGAYTTDVQYSIYNYENYINYSDSLCSNNEWKNNIIISSGTGSALRVDNNGTNNTFDYNLYYTNYSGANMFWGGGLGGSSVVFEAWRAGGQDKHSIVYRPSFTSANDLKPNLSDTASWALNGRAIHLDPSVSIFVGKDINGNTRPITRAAGVPDIGAYEITPISLPPLATASGPLLPGSTQAFLFLADTVAVIKWPVSVAVPDSVEVRQYSGVAPAGVAPANKFMYFYTDVKTDSVTSGFYVDSIAIYYRNTWLGTITSEQDVRLIRKSGNNPWALNGAALSQVDTIQNVITDQILPDFGLFSGTDRYNPLPLKLLSFKASVISKDVLLTWATASEINSNSFVVEHSINNKEWNSIGNVKANGNTHAVSNYQITDEHAFSQSNVIYYRLRIVDNDGSFIYSNTLVVYNKTESVNITVYPNPFTQVMTIELVSEKEETADIRIEDLTGRSFNIDHSRQIVAGNNIIIIDTDHLQPGIYFLSVVVNGEKKIVKVVKQ